MHHIIHLNFTTSISVQNPKNYMQQSQNITKCHVRLTQNISIKFQKKATQNNIDNENVAISDKQLSNHKSSSRNPSITTELIQKQYNKNQIKHCINTLVSYLLMKSQFHPCNDTIPLNNMNNVNFNTINVDFSERFLLLIIPNLCWIPLLSAV